MKFLMVGAGGVGGYFGGRLAAAGEDVRFIARGAHLAAMLDHGLKIESTLGDALIDPVTAGESATSADQGADHVDVVFIAVKIGDTASAIEACGDAVGPDTLVISLQNGLAAADMLSTAFGPERVAGGIAYIASSVAAPGVIRQIGPNQRIQLGELAGGPSDRPSPRLDRLAEVLVAAGVDGENVDDINLAMWKKFVFLVGLAATTSLTGETIGVIRADRDMRAFLHAAMAETAAVARARGFDLADNYADQCLVFADTLPEDMTSSMYHDVAAGKPLEVEWLSGAVAEMGAAAGIDTPVNATVFAALKSRRAGTIKDS